MKYIGNPNAINYIKSLPKRTKQPFNTLFPKANPKVCDLLAKMITFNPDKRITVEEAIEHPYFEGLHNSEAEPRAEKVFDWSWDNFEPKKDIL